MDRSAVFEYIKNSDFILPLPALVQCTPEWETGEYVLDHNALAYILDGKGYLTKDNEYIEPVPGQMYLIPKGSVSTRGIIDNSPYKLYGVNFYNSFESKSFIDYFDFPCCVTPKDPKYVESLFARLVYLQEDSSVTAKLEQKSVFYMLLCQYFNSCELTLKKDYSKNEFELKVSEYMYLHVNKGLSLDEIINLFGYSKEYFSHKFKQVMGTTPNRYIKELKMSEAKRMLRFTDMSINDISLKLGYETQHYFSYDFKKKFGMTPSEFRTQQ